MKKVLTVLAVLVLLTGVVFAAETHKIRVKSTVGEQLPVFQLVYGSTTSSATGVYSSSGSYSIDTAVDVGFNLDKGGSFTATAKINNSVTKAKTLRSFTLKFSDGVFTVSRTSDPTNTTFAPASITTGVKNPATGIYSITLSDVYKDNEEYDATEAQNNPAYNIPETIVDTLATNKPVVIRFNGATMEDDADIATAEYAYTADPTIDPTADGEYYYAYIVMTVEVN